MTAPLIKGYCPGALRPMQSGDGMVVRIRPFNGRLRRAHADGIASLASAHGNSMLDLSSRANMQLRGVTADSYAPLIEGLGHMGLLDNDEVTESRRNILVTPFWQANDETETLATGLAQALADPTAPAIPGKFGFAVDTGTVPVLQNASADIRLERDTSGGLLLAAEGSTFGKTVTKDTIIDEACALARWFMQNRDSQTRMAALLKQGEPLPADFVVPRQIQTYSPAPGVTPVGVLVGLAFGQLTAATLASLAKQGGLRLTPWRMLLIEGAHDLPDIDGLITNPADPLLRVVACSGAPACAQALAETRHIARRLAQYLKPEQFLHVSGCAKGCALPKTAPLTVTATTKGFDLIHNGRASDAPAQSALSTHDIIKAL